MLDIIVIFTALIALAVTFVYGVVNKLRFDKTLAYVFAFIYAAFIIGTTVIACKQAYF